MTYRTFPVARKHLRALFLTTCATALVAGLLAGGLDAQSLWTDPAGERGSLALEMLRPSFSDEEIVFEGATGAMIITGRLSVTSSLALVADLPLSHAAWNLDGESGSSSLFGNPYLGAEWRPGQRFTAEGGVRVPMGDLEDLEQLAPMLVGMAGEMDRLEAFAPETFGVYAAAAWQQPLATGLSFKLRGGTSFLAGDGGPEDLFLGYTGQLWYAPGAIRLGTGVTGRANVTTDDFDADRTAHQWVVAGDSRVGPLRPGLQLRVPLDESAREVSDYTLGMSLTWAR